MANCLAVNLCDVRSSGLLALALFQDLVCMTHRDPGIRMTMVILGPPGPSSSGQTVSANVSSLAAKPRADATGNSPAEASVSSRKGRKTDKRSSPSSAGAGPG